MTKLSTLIILLAVLALACTNAPAVVAALPTANATAKPAAPSLVPDVGTMVVCVDALNVRTQAGTSNATVAEPLNYGTIVTMSGQPTESADGGTWQQITNPLVGWVNVKYIGISCQG